MQRSRRVSTNMCDLPEELVDDILALLWNLESRCSTPTDSEQQQQRSAAAVVKAWASYRLVCRHWDKVIRTKFLELELAKPLTDSQLQWLTSSPAVVRSLTFAANERRAYKVLGSYHFQAQSAHALQQVHNLHIDRASDLTMRLALDFPRVRSLGASGAPKDLQFLDLPPSLRELQVEGLAHCQLRAGPPKALPPLPAADQPARPPISTQPLNPNLRRTRLDAKVLQVHPEWMAGASGNVELNAREIVLALPPRQIQEEDRMRRVEVLANLLVESGINRLDMSFSEMVLLDFVVAAIPMVVYVLLEGAALLHALERGHPGVFIIKKKAAGVVLTRRTPVVDAAAAAAPSLVAAA